MNVNRGNARKAGPRNIRPSTEHGDVERAASRSSTPASSQSSAQSPGGGLASSRHSSASHDIKQEPTFSQDILVIPTRSPGQLSESGGSDALESTGSTPHSLGKTGHRSFHSLETWEFFKPEIQRLYIDENKPLREVSEALDKRGFRATTKMYKTKFREWGFTKYNRKSDVIHMLNVQRDRAAVGKRSHFVRHGRRVDLEAYLKRKGITEYEIAEPEPALKASLPIFVRCKTPELVADLCRSPQAVQLQSLYIEYCQYSLFNDFHMSTLATGPADMSHVFWDQIGAHCWQPIEHFFEAKWLFNRGDTREAGLLMRVAFAELHEALRNDPREWLLILTYITIVKPTDVTPASELLKYLASLSAILAGKDSLLHRLCNQLKLTFEEGYGSYLDLIKGCGHALLNYGVGPMTMKTMVAQRLSLSSIGSATRTTKVSGVFNLGRWTLIDPEKHIPMRAVMREALDGIAAVPYTTAEYIGGAHLNDMFKSYCFLVLARHQREACSGGPLVADPRHGLARYYLDMALRFSSQDSRSAAPIDIDSLKLLETWSLEVGEVGRAAEIKALHDRRMEEYLHRVRSIPQHE